MTPQNTFVGYGSLLSLPKLPETTDKEGGSICSSCQLLCDQAEDEADIPRVAEAVIE